MMRGLAWSVLAAAVAFGAATPERGWYRDLADDPDGGTIRHGGRTLAVHDGYGLTEDHDAKWRAA